MWSNGAVTRVTHQPANLPASVTTGEMSISMEGQRPSRAHLRVSIVFPQNWPVRRVFWKPSLHLKTYQALSRFVKYGYYQARVLLFVVFVSALNRNESDIFKRIANHRVDRSLEMMCTLCQRWCWWWQACQH